MDADALTPAVGGLLLAVLSWATWRINQLRADTRQVRDQVQNTHSTNLREDLDGVRGALDRLAVVVDHVRRENASSLGTIRQDLGIVRADQRGVYKDVASLRDDVSTLRSHQSLTAREVAVLRAHVTEGDT